MIRNHFTTLALFLIFLGLNGILLGQSQMKNMAKEAISQKDYKRALYYYNQIPKEIQDAETILNRGICHFHMNQLSKAIADFTLCKMNGYESPLLLYLMAQSKHHLEAYEEALFFYRSYLKSENRSGDYVQSALDNIKNCLFALSYETNDQLYLVQNFGEEVNTIYDEIYPLQDLRQGNTYYLSSNRNKAYFEVYRFDLSQTGHWSESKSHILSNVSNQPQILQTISLDTSSNYWFKKGTQPGLYVLSKNKENLYSKLYLKGLPPNAIDLQIFDNHVIYFSAQLKDSYGGQDLYRMRYADGRWTDPENLGPKINSAYDERSPHVLANGTIYFSTNKPYGFGGFDIYKSPKAQGDLEPVNLGPEINSPGDDLHFNLDLSGQAGHFASNRKTGVGGFDVYFVYFNTVQNVDGFNQIRFEWISDQQKKEVKRKPKILPFSTLPTVQFTLSYEQTLPAKAPSLTGIKTNDVIVIDNKSPQLVEPVEKPKKQSVDLPYETTKSLVLPLTIFYEDAQDLIRSNNARKLYEIANGYIEGHIRIDAYTDRNERGLPEYVQYNTLKRAIKVAEFLINEGVPATAIVINSFANNYPFIKEELTASVNDTLGYMDKRLDVNIIDSKLSNVEQDSLEAHVPKRYMLANAFQIFRTFKEEVIITVSIARQERMFKHAALRLFDDIFIYAEGYGTLKEYCVGIHTNMEAAEETRDLLIAKGLEDAEIIVLYRGLKCDKRLLQKLSREMPELKRIIP